MDQLFFHPKVVHLPIALAMLMPLMTAGLAVAWWRSWLPRRAWLIAVALQLLLVGSGFVAMQSGEADEDRAERVVAEQYIEEHEEAAEVFMWSSGVVLALLLLAGAIPKERVALGLAGLATLGTVVGLGLGYRVGAAGGRLVYEHGAANVPITDGTRDAPGLADERGEHDDDDDDEDDDD